MGMPANWNRVLSQYLVNWRIDLAGAFGNYVNAGRAHRIGLLELAPDWIEPAGNPAFRGAKILLLALSPLNAGGAGRASQGTYASARGVNEIRTWETLLAWRLFLLRFCRSPASQFQTLFRFWRSRTFIADCQNNSTGCTQRPSAPLVCLSWSSCLFVSDRMLCSWFATFCVNGLHNNYHYFPGIRIASR